MSRDQEALLFAFLALIGCLPFVACQCKKNPVIFNFGDSNSDTGGYSAALGFNFGYPDGRTFFHQPTGRLCDGRLVIDFLCENLKTSYLSPYLDSLEPNFTNGVNFAISGSATLPRYVPFSLDVQVLQFRRFHNRSLAFQSKGFKNLVSEEDFKNALYTIDIGQNDLTAAFNSLSYADVVAKIPTFISEIRDAMWAMYLVGGKNFWVHNTGPLGCLPEKLGTRKTNATDFDQYGCIKSLNDGAKAFNAKLDALCQELRQQMKNATIVYVDMYSIKYDLIANSAAYGFKNPLMACCGYGGAPYNYNPDIKCRDRGCNLCEQELAYISWDGVHYTEAANAIVASRILSTNYSQPRLGFNFFCNNA
ncbi:GDSL esterase/lipase LIP-4 [Sesamum alatum]|uniref:GDSL esterase/lipase LIP-4 n=1 Tax=Sesamum alatum TaxID=300844 RepID=A0AAE1XU00_9LAMI|nr:GDSL esterase/lipase LIP-4 [Sesamum alatum]